MTKYSNLINKPVPQSEPLDSRQIKNNAGGHVYGITIWQRLERFLILGSDRATYYQKAEKLTRENAAVVEQCWTNDPARTSQIIVEISEGGRAPRNDAAIFALVLGSLNGYDAARTHAYLAVSKVCRTGTHLLQFVATAKAMGKGFGRGMKRAIANWYLDKDADALAYQLVKYRQREGLTHENVLDMARPKATDASLNGVLGWAVGKPLTPDTDVALPQIVHAFAAAQTYTEKSPKAALELVCMIDEYRLPWEALPTWALTDVGVLKTLIRNAPYTATLRNLANWTRHGAITPMSYEEQVIVTRLTDIDQIRKSKVHPMAILIASRTYAAGTSPARPGKDPFTWSPVRSIVAALEKAFIMAFANVEPSNKRTLLALDVSGSMGTAFVVPGLSAREASAAMMAVTLQAEPVTHVVGFTGGGGLKRGGGWHMSGSGVDALAIDKSMGVQDICRYVDGLTFGRTDCAQPMLYATAHKIPVDTFVIYTDNETWAGSVHPMAALKGYRKLMGIDAKLIVVGMTATQFSIADPQDGGCLDVVGFDASAPAVMAQFAK